MIKAQTVAGFGEMHRSHIMKKLPKKLLIGLTIWACTIGLAEAQTPAPPPLIPYYGTMTGSAGGLVTATFAFYEEHQQRNKLSRTPTMRHNLLRMKM